MSNYTHLHKQPAAPTNKLAQPHLAVTYTDNLGQLVDSPAFQNEIRSGRFERRKSTRSFRKVDLPPFSGVSFDFES